MTNPFQFADKLSHYVDRTAYTPGQLASLTGLPRTTIVNWLNGRVQRPRDWQPLLQLLAVLHLTESEANDILRAANQPTIADLRHIADPEEQPLLAAWEQPTRQTPPIARPPFQAVADTHYFVGRQEILSQLQTQLLAPDGTNICVLQGMAGTGKTAVAARIAYQLRPHFPDGVLWARLDISSPMMILHTFAHAYGADVSQYDDTASRSRVVRDLLADKRVLIILDNALDSAAVEPLLPPTGRCAVLITTRRHDLRVAQVANRFTLHPFRTDSEAAQKLFAHFLGRERADEDAGPLAKIADLVGHLPLALAIAAGRLAYEPGWSTAEFLNRLQQSSRRLKELQSEDQNIRLSFDASYGLAPEAIQSFFAALSRFGGQDFSSEAAAAAARIELPDAQDYLRMLYRLSLAQTGQSGRYHLHPLLRDYAAERLPDDASWSPLVDYYLDFLAQHNLGDAAVALESDNISAVISGALEDGETAVPNLIAAFAPHLKLQGRYVEAQSQLEAALETAGDDHRLPILLNLSQIARYYRRYDEADSYLESAVPLAQQQHDIYHQSAIETEKGIIAGCRGDYAAARRHFQDGLELAGEHNRPTMLIPLLKELGASEMAHADYDAAQTHYQEALTLSRREAPVYEPILLRCLGGIALIRDQDFEAANKLYSDGLDKARAMNSQEDIIFLLNNLAAVSHHQGKTAEARSQLKQGLELARPLLHQVGQAMIRSNLGRIAAQEQDWPAARQHLQEALSIAMAANHPELIAALRRSLDQLDDLQQSAPSADSPALGRLKIFYD